MNIKEAAGILPDYDEIMDRQRDAEEMKAEEREQNISDCQKAYFEDVGTFFEFIQNIEIAVDEEPFYEGFHKDVLNDNCVNVNDRFTDLYMSYCREKAVKDVDTGCYP